MVAKRLHLVIKGIVQGVFFRTTSRDIATNLFLNGWVKNLDNGDVEIVVEGEKKDLDDFLKWAKNGTEASDVQEVIETWSDFKDEFDDFKIIDEDVPAKIRVHKDDDLKKIDYLLKDDENVSGVVSDAHEEDVSETPVNK